MKLFKNRGDIYISKANKEKSIEQRLLLAGLAVTVAFTVIFVLALGIKYDFSAKEFFAPDEEITTAAVEDDADTVLPEVSGKSNFLLTVHKNGNLLFTAVVQADLDNISYKATVFKNETVTDGQSLDATYARGGVQNVTQAVEALLTTTVDYYIDMDAKAFEELYNNMGTVTFPVLNEIHYKNNDTPVPYSVRCKAGEQKIKGGDFIDLIRYYLDEDLTSSAGDLVLASLSQHIGTDFFEKKEAYFTELVTNAETNITIRDFSLADTAFTVLTNDRVGVGVYNAYAEYDESNITNLQSVKGYYSK